MTTKQVYAQTKDVTRRIGWAFLKPGDVLQAVEKAQGLKKGEKVKRICKIVVKSTRWEPLDEITQEDCIREGFPEMSPAQFVEMFCRANKWQPDKDVNRIEFRYLEDQHKAMAGGKSSEKQQCLGASTCGGCDPNCPAN